MYRFTPAPVPHTPSEAPQPRLYRPDEIAETLGCSAWWVKDRARRCLIPHTRVGRAYRFTAEHLAEIIRLHEERPAQPAQTTGRATEPLSEPTTQTGSRQPRRPAVAPTTRLRARSPRRQQQYSAVV
ncbi:helix-turn-helix domain-containing protein [Streptomyces sp. TG1A-8]|uniref:helix-turn-helix domain-containing protein n=1 Tax=Streptomyces sp. TG1A-8 TaxID=3051385 RepID=UPI00265BACFC|nr:helix-turn-helix domain-containing protein [Streptomyces sp. TG1A-8]MDO0926518.1 helix-turn-helix domain-containing protein [Streptomyces sp. TG1A-8]